MGPTAGPAVSLVATRPQAWRGRIGHSDVEENAVAKEGKIVLTLLCAAITGHLRRRSAAYTAASSAAQT